MITAAASAAAVSQAAAQSLPQAATCTCPTSQEQGVYVPQQETVVREQTAFGQDQLDQLLAPIALYPDDLLAQILTASTYPLEVTAAARWSKEHPGVSGDLLDEAMLRQPWDASVKGLTAVPQVLAMMSEQLDWTEQLGEAFLAQQDAVTSTVQALRAKAAAAGTLRESKEIKVARVAAPADAAGNVTEYIQIESATPDYIRVPVYDPGVVYGAWSYPQRRPFFWRPPGYAYAGAVGFTAAVAVGSALWTRYDWRERRVWIDPGRYNRFNRTNYAVGTQLGWRYSVKHRGNAPYRHVSVTHEYVPSHRRPSFVSVPAGQTLRGREGGIERRGGFDATVHSRTTVVTPPGQTLRGRTTVVTPPAQTIRGREGGVERRGGVDHPMRGRSTTLTPPKASPNPPPRGVDKRAAVPPAVRPVTTAPRPPVAAPPKPRTVAPPPRSVPQRAAVPPAPKPVVTKPRPPVATAPKPRTVAPPPRTVAPRTVTNNRPPAARPALDCRSAGKPPGWKRPAACPR